MECAAERSGDGAFVDSVRSPASKAAWRFACRCTPYFRKGGQLQNHQIFLPSPQLSLSVDRRRFSAMGILFETKRWLAVLILACGVLPLAMTAITQAAESTTKGAISLTSSAFGEGAPIPEEYTCQGKDVSPPLKWSGVPAETKSLALIMDDPDAPMGTWVHWVLYDLAPSMTELPEGLSAKEHIAAGSGKEGVNDFKRPGYGGPCPPAGKPHRYFFKLYALDTTLDLKPSAKKKDLERAMEKHILGQGQLMATYKRK
jgi:Raf kinase inhibitor-like YbhB/YbcL family protein